MNAEWLYRATYMRLGTEAHITFAEHDMDSAQHFMQRMCSYFRSTSRQPAKVLTIEPLRKLHHQLDLMPPPGVAK